jgi:pyridoxamine 5'-phosphate oxidase
MIQMKNNADMLTLLNDVTPFRALSEWMKTAFEAVSDYPQAAQLATVDEAGIPNVRTVLVREFGPDGFVFYTNLRSTKGRELAASPKAALLFYWRSLSRQIRIRGNVRQVSPRDADKYFAGRPRESQVGAHASKQSSHLSNREMLEAEVNHHLIAFAGRVIPRPPHWSGFRIVPITVEFWQEQPHRLHQRVLFEQHGTEWKATLLYP